MPAEIAPVKFYKFRSSDGFVCKISEKATSQSATLQLLLSTKDISSDDPRKAIPLDNIDGKTLQLVFRWCDEYKNQQVSTEKECQAMYATLPKFDAKLVRVDDDTPFELLCAADYLDIKS